VAWKKGLPPTQAQLVFQAVKRGHQTPKGISMATGIGLSNVNTLLYNLRRKGKVRGFSGAMKAIRAPISKVGGRKPRGKSPKKAAVGSGKAKPRTRVGQGRGARVSIAKRAGRKTRG
jgi:hypothetical protein